MLSLQQKRKIEEFARSKVKNNDVFHNTDHTVMTVKLARFLAKKEKADLQICEAAAWLHDIAHKTHYLKHESEGAKISSKFLRKLKINRRIISQIGHTIECHGSKYITNAKTKEAKILFDADKLQTAGTYGFCRLLGVRLFKGMSLIEAIKDARKSQLKYFQLLQTESGKKIAGDYQKISNKFWLSVNKWLKDYYENKEK